MNKPIVLTFVLLAFILTGSEIHKDFNIEKVWSSSEKLSSDDFTLKKCSSSDTFKAGTASQLRVSEPKLSKKGLLINTKIVFNKEKSWMCERFINSKLLLNHEQRHFDIAEICRRRMNSTILNSSHYYDDLTITLNNQIDDFFIELDSIQHKYDFETNHSTLWGQQNKWNQWIDSVLNNTNADTALIVSWDNIEI